MPYLQLDVPNHYPFDVKRCLARRMGDIFVRIMQTTPDLVTVAFRELGKGVYGGAATASPNLLPFSRATSGVVVSPNSGPNWPKRS
jgi:phenylpyruvate tautomerase PptA (4-oxalocrotonate tautomerase family)